MLFQVLIDFDSHSNCALCCWWQVMQVYVIVVLFHRFVCMLLRLTICHYSVYIKDYHQKNTLIGAW